MAPRSERQRRPVRFTSTGRNEQKHGNAIYGVSWSTDTFIGHDEATYHYVATCGHNTLTLYKVEDSARGEFCAQQIYRDTDREESFYTCAFAGRSEYTSNESSSSGSSGAGSPSPGGSTSEESSTLRYESGDETTGQSGNQFTLATSQTVGPQLVCVSGSSTIIKVVDPLQRKIVTYLRGHRNDVYDLKTSPVDENLLLSASVDETIRLWNLSSWACVAIFAGYNGHRGEVLSVSWHSDGTRFASAGKDTQIRLWNIDAERTREALQASTRVHPSLDRQSFHPLTLPFPYFSTNKVHVNQVDCVQFCGDLILSKSTYNMILLWYPVIPEGTEPSYTSGSTAHDPPSDVVVLKEFTLDDCEFWFVRFAMDWRGSLLAVGNTKGEIHVWEIDRESPKESQVIRVMPGINIRTLAFNPSGDTLIACLDNGQVRKFNWM